MPLIDDADVQTHLPFDRLQVEAIPDDLDQQKLDAERIVRALLTGVIDTAVMATWTTPASTPETIRAIAGRFCAAHIYRVRFGQNAYDDPEYAQNLYNEAMSLINQIITGEIVLPGIDPATQIDDSWFWPNNSTDDPKFAMADRY